MLPYERSFDWANDGGLIRPVEMLITGESFLLSPSVTAKPMITACDCRQDEGSAVFGLKTGIDGRMDEKLTLAWKLYEGCDGAETLVTGGCVNCKGEKRRFRGEFWII